MKLKFRKLVDELGSISGFTMVLLSSFLFQNVLNRNRCSSNVGYVRLSLTRRHRIIIYHLNYQSLDYHW